MSPQIPKSDFHPVKFMTRLALEVYTEAVEMDYQTSHFKLPQKWDQRD